MAVIFLSVPTDTVEAKGEFRINNKNMNALKIHSGRQSIAVRFFAALCVVSVLSACSGDDESTSSATGGAAGVGGTNGSSAGAASSGASGSAGQGGSEAVFYSDQPLFENKVDGYPMFRIPALITAQNGDLIAFSEGRQSILDDGDIDIVVRRSTDFGQTWSDIAVVVDNNGDTAGNATPILLADSGRLLLVYCVNPGDDANNRSVFVLSSDDNGNTWSEPRDITASIKPSGWTWYATGPGRGIVTKNGRIVVPCNHEDESGVRSSHIIFSDDGGDTWQLGGSAAPKTDESTVAQLSDGRLLMNMRYEGDTRARAIAFSEDEGVTFSDTTFDQSLPDADCEGNLLTVAGGLLFSNAATTKTFPRDHLTVRLSENDGANWRYSKLLEEGPSAYSAMSELSDGTIGILYEQGQALPYDRLKFARFNMAWLSSK